MLYIIAIASLVILVALHELGHFLAAKAYNVKVDEFGIGIPPRLFGKKIGETVYSLNLLPIGAFVKIFGADKKERDKRSFSEKTVFQRAMIVLGGVIAFWVVAFMILTVVMILGMPSVIDDGKASENAQVVIVEVTEGMSASEAGLIPGDIIKSLKSESEYDIFAIDRVSDVQEYLLTNKGERIVMVIARGNDFLPEVITPNNEGLIGVGLVRTEIVNHPFYIAPLYGAEATIQLTRGIVSSLFETVRGAVLRQSLPENVQFVGPVGIVSEIAVTALQRGITHYLWIIAVIAVSLGIINLLPIPALDGGRFLFLLIEKMKGSPLSQKAEQSLISVSFILLLLVFAVITFQDIQRIIFK